ncbi:MAG: type II secretion system F family protein [Chloroflexota bacterium]|uniref:type II secretion system F family protein n=1 Tax=Bellilinea sp. TaxID=2838785 RepID=UPI002ADDE9AE|nr:type II secretion system F family protein [Bellilinea sp.]
MIFSPTMVLLIGGGFAFLLLILGIVVSITSERSMVEERLGRYVETQQQEILSEKRRSTPLTDWLNRRVERSTLGDRISQELSRADLKLRPGEFIALVVITIIVMAGVGYVIGQYSVVTAIIGAIIGGFLPRFYVKRQQNKRLIRFNEQLSDMLNLMVNGLRAGYSTMQAMEAVSKELPSPISDEFHRVVQEMQLGITMEKAMDNLLKRIPSDDLDLVITAINVQREVGGNLAEILDTISFTIRERVRIKGEIRVLTTQVMYSGKFLSLLPLILIGVLYLLNRDYIMTFFKPESVPCGYIALGVAAILIISGYFTMTKLADIEV